MHMEEEDDLGGEMSFGDHLEELRSRLVRSILSTVVVFCIIFVAKSNEVLEFVVAPYTDVAVDLRINSTLNYLEPTSAFFSYMKVSLIVAFLITTPFWMWQFWSFIGVGLYAHEKRAVYKFAPPMIFLFIGGVSFGYSVLIPTGLRYLLSFADSSLLQSWISLSSYLSLFTTLTLVLGITFQLPVFMALLTKIGVVQPSTYREKRRFFILGAFIFGALLTPPDAVTQILMASPLVFLFEIGIACAWIAQGEDRAPIEWKRWRTRTAVVLAVVVLLGFTWDSIVQSYRARLAHQRIRLEASAPKEGVPYFRVLSECDFLGFKADRMFVLELSDESEIYVASDGKVSRLVEFQFRDDRVTKTSSEARAARFLVNSAAQSVVVKDVADQDDRPILKPFFDHLAHAEPNDVALMESMIAGLMKTRPAGTRALAEQEDVSEIESVRAAWLAWFKAEGHQWRPEGD